MAKEVLTEERHKNDHHHHEELCGCGPVSYTHLTAKLQRRNETYDEISARVGVRSFSCDPNKGFIINGAETPLRGVSRHQDMLYKGNALTKEDQMCIRDRKQHGAGSGKNRRSTGIYIFREEDQLARIEAVSYTHLDVYKRQVSKCWQERTWLWQWKQSFAES